MDYLLDTNVVSEFCKKEPLPAVLLWLEEQSDNLFLSVISIEELKFGECMMPKGKRRNMLKEIIDNIIDSYSAKTLSFDANAAIICAEFHEISVSSGRSPHIEDLMIAAIAKAKNMTVATRNVKDFEYLPIQVFNPFK